MRTKYLTPKSTRAPGVLFPLDAFAQQSDDGFHLLQRGMEQAGWISAGYGMRGPRRHDSTNVEEVLRIYRPRAVLLWPRWQWDWAVGHHHGIGPEHCLQNWHRLLDDESTLRVTVLRDAAALPDEHRRWHDEFRPHRYLVWHHARSVRRLWPGIAEVQLIRTRHTVDAALLAEIGDAPSRPGTCVLFGEIQPDEHPLLWRLHEAIRHGRTCGLIDEFPPRDYSLGQSESVGHVQRLSAYKVAICGASAHRFCVREIFEATLAGCIVITDLPRWDMVPWIDGNLIRVPTFAPVPELLKIIKRAADEWNPAKQRRYAAWTAQHHDYRVRGREVAEAIKQAMEVK